MEALVDALRTRLDKAKWRSGLDALVAEELARAGATAGLGVLAELASERAAAGNGADASRLAAAALRACGPPPSPEDEGVDRDMLREDDWARWRLVTVLREGPKTGLKGLDEVTEGRLDSEHAAPLRAGPGEPDALEEETTARVACDGANLGDALWAIDRSLSSLDPRREPVAVLRVSRVALGRGERVARDLGAQGAAGLWPLRKRLWARLLDAWVGIDDSDPEHVATRRWLTGSSGGAPRTRALEPSWLAPAHQEALLTLLRDKHSRTQTSTSFGEELLRLGRSELTLERRVELAREVGAVAELMDALFEAGKGAEAVEVALAEARAGDAGDLAFERVARLGAAGHDEAALDYMRAVIKTSVDARHFEWLAERLVALGRPSDALEVRRELFERRCGLATYESLREHAKDSAWAELRAELLERLRERKLYRVLLDIAFAEEDVDLVKRFAAELDEHQQAYARQRLDAREDAFAKALEGEFGEPPTEHVGQYVPRASVPPPQAVRHKKYGVGRVLSHRGDGEHRKLEIEFEGVGVKTILERFVTPVEG